jgi:alanine dehydrogenase
VTNATFPFVRRLANRGWQEGSRRDPALMKGLNIVNGKITHAGVAEAFGLPFVAPETVI